MWVGGWLTGSWGGGGGRETERKRELVKPLV